MKNTFVLLILLLVATSISAQDYPVKGKPIPNYHFKEIESFSNKTASISDFEGKWLILDFWSRNCAQCISSFPKYNKLQKIFNDKIQILLVGYNSQASNTECRNLYKRMKLKQGLDLPVAWDTTLFKKFDGAAVPYVIMVDPKGLVRAITYSLDSLNIINIIDGLEPQDLSIYRMAHYVPDNGYNFGLPLLTSAREANGGKDTAYISRSLFTEWNETMPEGMFSIHNGLFEVTNATLSYLYNIAFTGKIIWNYSDTILYGNYYPYPIIMAKDPSLFGTQDKPASRKFSYSLKIPNCGDAMSKDDLLFLKNDLLNVLTKVFRYSADVETVPMPIYKLITIGSKSKNELETKGNSPKMNVSTSGLFMENMPISEFAPRLLQKVSGCTGIPIYDCTKINTNIDINIKCNMTDIKDIQAALEEKGLSLVKDEKEMKVVVIKDEN